MTITANDITDAAYRKIRIKAPSGHGDVDALEALNNMVSMWGVNLFPPYVVREYFLMAIGKGSYTIGADGDFDTIRPLSIVNVYLKDKTGGDFILGETPLADSYDYPVRILAAKDWNKISHKHLLGKPRALYYIPEYPLGVLKFDKNPDQKYAIEFEFCKNFIEFTTLTTAVDLPAEYKEALVYNLAVRLAEDNAIKLPISIYATAKSSLILLSRQAIVNRLPSVVNLGFGNNRPTNIVTGD
jgi:hypothetical protein